MEKGTQTECNIEIREAAMLQLLTTKVDTDDDKKDVIIENGLRPPILPKLNASLCRKPFNQIAFIGKCYKCGCTGHSQRFCPLRYCSRCGTYGHSSISCKNPN